MLRNKRKIPRDTQKFFHEIEQFENFVAISRKSRSCPQSLQFKEKNTNIHIEYLRTVTITTFKTCTRTLTYQLMIHEI